MKTGKKILIFMISSILFLGMVFPAFATDPVLIQSIQLDQETAIVSTGKTINLKATIVPKNASNKKLEWFSSDETIATVSNGKIKGLTAGSVTITVKAADGSNAEASAAITVVQPVKKITVAEPKLILAPGISWKQTVSIEPSDATIQSLVWSSSNDSIASVNEEGIIQALAVGKCSVTGIAADDSKQKVNVQIQVIEHDYLILEPAEINVDFETRNTTGTPKTKEPYVIDENGKKVIVTDEMFEKARHIDAGDGRNLVSIPDRDENYRYFEKDPTTGRIFETQVRQFKFYINGKEVKQDTEETTVTYKNGLVCEGSEEYKLRPLKAGSETIDIVTKLNGKKVTDQKKYTVFISQNAAPTEGDKEIGRLEAESYDGHTYQIFYSTRPWKDAKEFCESHGGHLVTITSQKEQKYLERYLAKANKKQSYWIGMTKVDNNRTFTTWITKEGISFTKWADGSPHINGPDACVMIAADEYIDQNNRTLGRGTWNDEVSAFFYINGFICEWDEDNSSNALQTN